MRDETPQMTEQVQAWMAERADAMADLLETLIAMDTENPPGRRLGECGRLLARVMADLDLAPDLIMLDPARELDEPCILRGAVGDGANGRTIYFHGHVDVVPAQSPAQFQPQRVDGRIIGRGAADMKGGLVSMLYGAVAARDLGLLGEGRIVLHIVCDEETGSVTGSGHLRAAEMIDPNAVAMLTAEPTGGVVWHASRGAITLQVQVEGHPAHVGQAHLGRNAFAAMVQIAQPLTTLATQLLERRTSFPMPDDAARGSMLVVGGASGSGASFNVVPGSAWFSVDRRFNPEEDLHEELDTLQMLIEEGAARAGTTAVVDVLQQQPSAGTDMTHPAAQTLAASVAAVHGTPPAFEMCPGVLDIRWYNQLGVPAFAYGGGHLEVSHGPDEYIDEQAMRDCATVYALYARDMLA